MKLPAAALALLAFLPPALAAPLGSPAAQDHAALHPADALLFVELPDVQATWELLPKAPLARLVLDERVQSALETLSGASLSEWLARPPAAVLRAQAAGLTRGLAAASLSTRVDALEDALERDGRSVAIEPGQELAVEAALEYASAERASEVLGALAEVLGSAGHLERRTRDGDPEGLLRFGDDENELFLWSDDRLVRVGFGRTSPERMRARTAEASLAGADSYAAAMGQLKDERGVATLRGTWRPGASVLRTLAERAAGQGGEEVERLRGLAALLGDHLGSAAGQLAFQMRQHERGFVWESFQPSGSEGDPVPLRALLEQVPADAAGVWITSFDASFWWEVAGLVDETGSLARWSREAAEAEIDVENDLFGQLGPGLALYLPPPGGLALPRAQIWIELGDAERFGRALDALALRAAEQPAAAGGLTIARSEFRGTSLTAFEPASGPVQPTLAIVDGKLLAMLQPSHVKRFLRDHAKDPGAAGTFAAREDVAPRLKSLEGADGLLFLDWGGILGGYYRTGLALASLAGLTDGGGSKVDFSALPDPQIFPDHLLPTWRVARRVASGTHVLRETSFGPEVPIVLLCGAVAAVPRVMQGIARGHEGRVSADLNTIYQALANYAIENGGRYPESLEVLLECDRSGLPYLAELPVDPWGRPYLYMSPADGGGRPRLYTLGADGEPGGEGEDADVWMADLLGD